jgi:pyruvate dehydrogenase E2 component (dihydrolipoamide acetyltransferase)
LPNVELEAPKNLPPFRKIAIGTWQRTYDPSVYGTLSVRMEPALEFIERFRERTGKRLTVTHLVAKAAAIALTEMPDANAILRFNKIYPRKRVSVFLQVAMTDPVTGKLDLSGTTIHDADKLSIQQILETTEKNVELVRTRKDKALEKSRSTFLWIPSFALNGILRFLSFVLYTLNLDLSALGLPKDGFGSIMVTNVGSLGLDVAYVPIVPWSRVPILVAVGKVSDEPVVEDGRVVSGKIMRLSATFDHRLIDGAHAAVLARSIQATFADPEKAFGEPSASDAPRALPEKTGS